MRIQVLTHVDFEGPGRIELWAKRCGHSLDVLRADQVVPLPDLRSVDMLVIMGGPMSVNDGLAWQNRERAWIEQALSLNLPALGVCLGAQLLAQIHGARVFPGPVKEIGWWPVQRVSPDGAEGLSLPKEFVPLHWHGETFDLPRGALHLVATNDVPHQGFLLGDRIIGLQFHPEATPVSVAAIVEGAQGDIMGGRREQAPQLILKERVKRCVALVPLVDTVLDWLALRARTQ